MGLAVVAGLGMVLAQGAAAAIVSAIVMGFMLGGWLGPGYGLLLTLTPAAIRGRVTAASQLFTNLVGVGLGPLATGALSDWFGGADSLRYALACTMLLGLLSAALFAAAGRMAGTDLRRLRMTLEPDRATVAQA
jgi:MFS family permease